MAQVRLFFCSFLRDSQVTNLCFYCYFVFFILDGFAELNQQNLSLAVYHFIIRLKRLIAVASTHASTTQGLEELKKGWRSCPQTSYALFQLICVS